MEKNSFCLKYKDKLIFCHRDVRFRYAPTTAKVCNNGNFQTVRVPRDYPTLSTSDGKDNCHKYLSSPPTTLPPTIKTTPACVPCFHKNGQKYCSGDEVPPSPNRKSLKRQCLQDGKIYLVNKLLDSKVLDQSSNA